MADIYAEVTAVGIQGLSGTGTGTGDGATGATGPAGATGPQGPAGASGVGGGSGNGATGSTGAQGASGVAGATGPQGASGGVGASGISGASGYVGSDGASGATGPQGPGGASGVVGASGASIKIIGSVIDASYLDASYTGDIGDGYIANDTGHLWVWNGTDWTDVGAITGPTGATGRAGATGFRGASGATGITGASGISGASGLIGATGVAGADALWNFTGAYSGGSSYAVGDVATYNGQTWYRINSNGGNVGDTPAEGIFWTLIASQGASGVDGASGYVGSDGATGLTGATGFGLGQTVFTTSSTNRVVVETIDTTLYRSAKYEMQVTSSTKYQALEFRLLIDDPNVFLVQYGSIGTSLGTFETFYSPLSNDYTSPAINTGGLSYWNGTTFRVYTTDNAAIQALLSIPSGTVLTLNSGATTLTTSGSFTEVSSGVYGVTSVETRSPTLLISRIQWTGNGQVELRFTPDYAVTTLKYLRTTIDI